MEAEGKVAVDVVNEDRYIILFIVLIGIFMSVLDGSVVNIALPTVTAFFRVDLAQSQWAITGYMLTLTSLLLVFGKVSEYVGKPTLFKVGFTIFTLASLACGLSGSLVELILFRVVQAAGASMVFSISMAIIVQAFPKRERGRALGFIGTTVAMGAIVGPILGGFLVDALGWQYIFLINVPIGVVMLALALKYLRLREARPKAFSLDWAGAALLVASVASLMLMLGDLAACRTFTLGTAAYAAIFAGSLLAFLAVESRHGNPVLDLSIFKVRRFTLSNLGTLLNFIGFSSFNLVMPFYLETVMDYRPSQVGQMLIVIPLVMAVAAPLSGWLYDRFESAYHSSAGLLVTALAMILLSFLVSGASLVTMGLCFAAIGLGNGLFQSPNSSEVMSALPPQKNSMASSTLATVRNFGMAMGVSLASIMLSVQLAICGFDGPVIGASPPVLSQVVGAVLLVNGLICMAGVGASLVRNIDSKKVDY